MWHSAQGQHLLLPVSFCLFLSQSPVRSMSAIEIWHPSWEAKLLHLLWNIKLEKLGLHTKAILSLYQWSVLQAEKFFFPTDIHITVSPVSSLAVLVNVYPQSTCSIHKGEMFTLTPLSSTILSHFCLSPAAFVLPPHASRALSLSLFPSYSSCPVETQSELSSRSLPAHSSTFAQISLLQFLFSFLRECLFLSALALCQLHWHFL